MALKQYKPTSPARRGLILVDKSSLWKGKPVKALTEGKRKTGGRNNKGHVTSRGIAGGHKQKYRTIDFKRRTWDVAATVERLEYDPNRSAFIALVIDGDALNVGFARASSNLESINLLSAVGANVYDIMRHETLVLTRAAVEKLEARFNG